MAFRRRAPKEPSPPELTALTISESQWRGQQLEAARRLVERYCGTSEMPPSLPSLDEAVSGWFEDHDSDRPDANDVVSAIGVALGHHLVRATALIWVMATDDVGTEIAVHDPETGRLVRPSNLVADHLVANDRGFVTAISTELVARTLTR